MARLTRVSTLHSDDLAQCAKPEAPQAPSSFADMISNATEWEYPIDLHAAICCELRVNPRTWVVPRLVKEVWANHIPHYEDMLDVEAFSDEAGNVVYFFDPRWTEQYRLWVIYHELFHQTQFYDLGNIRGTRWEDLGTKQRHNQWEKEACKYADEKVGGAPGKDFSPYTDMVLVTDKEEGPESEQPQIAPRLKFGRKRNATARMRMII